MRYIGFLPFRNAEGKLARREFATRLAGAKLVCVMDASHGLVMMAEAGLKLVVSSDGRILLGAAFDLSGRLARANDLDGAAVEDLITRFWGPYVALAPLSGPAGATFGRFAVARDPSGGLACYIARAECGVFITSDLGLALSAGLPAPSIDWAMLAHDLVYRRGRGRRTCLMQVDELAPGAAAVIGSESIETNLAWDPWRVASAATDRLSHGEAASGLREQIDLCTGALGGLFARPVIELSGGLDSSIVAAALAGRDGLSAVHCVSPGPEGDERRYARAVAAAFDLPVEEHVLQVGHFDPLRLVNPTLPRPGRPGVLSAAHRIVQSHCREREADAVFTGAGGDSVFCSLSTPAPVADRFWREGPGPGFFRSLSDLSVRHNAPLWKVARMTARSIGKRFDPARGATFRFLSSRVLSTRQDLHPWLEAAPEHSRLGQSLHIESIAFILGYMEGQGRDTSIPTLAPLMSRPVLEACLRIPAWRWIEGGRDRAVARAAYRGTLPDLIVDRRSKGGIDHYVVGLFERNRGALRELLLEGLLAEAGLLDRLAVEAAFSASEVRRVADAHRLLELVDAEAWAQGWRGAVGVIATRDEPPP